MHDRVREEIKAVEKKHPGTKFDEDLSWILIPEFPLPPARFHKEVTRLLFRIPVGYPSTAPDNFFVDHDLSLRGGGSPPGFNGNSKDTHGPAPVPGDWGWFSWHPVTWRPAAKIEDGDNLLTFLRGVSMCLRGESF